MISKNISILTIAILATVMITAVTFSNMAVAEKTKAQLTSQIKNKQAKIAALKEGGTTAAEKAQIKALKADIKSLKAQRAALDDTGGQGAETGTDDTTSQHHQEINQANSNTQSSSCGDGNHTNSCNNSATQTNNNTGGNSA